MRTAIASVNVQQNNSEHTSLVQDPPSTARLMSVVRGYTHSKLIFAEADIVTQTSSAIPVESEDFRAVHSMIVMPTPKELGAWLDKYDKITRSELMKYNALQHELRSSPQKYISALDIEIPRLKNQAAINLLESWISEEPDENEVRSLEVFQETVDEQRVKERKLFE